MTGSTTSLFYCVQWFRANKCPTEVLTECQASKRHADGQLYTVLVGDPNRPRCFLEFSAYRSVAVEFLDPALRTSRSYSFQEKEPNRLFATMIGIPHFPTSTGEPDRGTVYYIEAGGHVAIVQYETYPSGVGSYIVGREERIVDVTNLWEPFPEFGRYDGLARFDRGISLINERP